MPRSTSPAPGKSILAGSSRSTPSLTICHPPSRTNCLRSIPAGSADLSESEATKQSSSLKSGLLRFATRESCVSPQASRLMRLDAPLLPFLFGQVAEPVDVSNADRRRNECDVDEHLPHHA